MSAVIATSKSKCMTMKQDNPAFHRESELKKQLIDIQKEFVDNNLLSADSVDINGLFRLKNVLSSVNNLITLLATCGFVDYLERREFITAAQADEMKAAVQSQHANTNGYDIACFASGCVPVVAEVKCNIPVKGDEFGSAQRDGIFKDVKGLLSGKNRIEPDAAYKFPDAAYKFMVILNADRCSASVDTRSAVDRLLSKLKAEGSDVMIIPDDNSSLTMNTVYFVILDL